MITEQLTLLQLEATPPPAPIWEADRGALGKLFARYTHMPSGWVIHHCGHPTANFPYYIVTPAGDRILASNGRGFQRLNLAKQYVMEAFQNA